MATTVFTMPTNYPEAGEEGIEEMRRWVEAEGLPPLEAMTITCFRVDREDDGTLTCHFLELEWPRRPNKGPGENGWEKTPRSIKVTSLPQIERILRRRQSPDEQ